MNRYVSSLFLSIIVYSSTIGAALYFLNKEDFITTKPSEQKVKCIKFTMITPEEPTKSIETKPKPIEKPKPKPEPKFIPKPKPKPKPVPKPEPKEAPQPEPEPKKHIKEKTETKQINTAKQSPMQSKIDSTKSHYEDEKLAKQNIFISNLRKKIDQNKSYPNSARRRVIEGEVKIKFNILANGNVKNIEMVSGKKIFKKSAIQAVERSFPVKVDKNLFNFPKEFKVSLIYTLKR